MNIEQLEAVVDDLTAQYIEACQQAADRAVSDGREPAWSDAHDAEFDRLEDSPLGRALAAAESELRTNDNVLTLHLHDAAVRGEDD
ncbi:MAG: hypothetical protein OXG36_11635 [Caldilineaceae bacterium]|nr:hypothetical protein [Caldilineaceae bacterium]